MIPSTVGFLDKDFEIEVRPSLTYQMEMDSHRIRGYTDGLEAVRQAVYKIIMTERYQYIMYSWNYGIELQDLFGEPVTYVCPELKRRISEALLWDERIRSVDNFAFDFPPQKIHLEAKRPDGACDVANVSVVAVVPYLIMKAAAMGRGKAKDAYDIYFLLKHYRGGVKELAKEFQPAGNRRLVQEMKEKLSGKFASADHAGPKDVADFLGLDDDEDVELIKRDAYEQVQALLNLV